MERMPKGIYTPEFRAAAVTLVELAGLSVDAAAKRLSVPKSSSANWGRASREGKLTTVGQGQRVSTRGVSARLRHGRKRAPDRKQKSRRRISGHARPTGRNACHPILPITVSRRASIVSSGFARNTDCAASRSGNSRRQRIRAMRCRWPPIFCIGNSR